MAHKKFCRSQISGSRAALEITVVPSAPQAAKMAFSVAPTLGSDSTICAPRIPLPQQLRQPPRSRTSAPRVRRAARCRSMGRGPSSQPPG